MPAVNISGGLTLKTGIYVKLNEYRQKSQRAYTVQNLVRLSSANTKNSLLSREKIWFWRTKWKATKTNIWLPKSRTSLVVWVNCLLSLTSNIFTC